MTATPLRRLPLSGRQRPIGLLSIGTASVRQWWKDRLGDLRVLMPVLLVVGVVHAWNMFNFPGRIDDEGTYLAQAWAVRYRGVLAHYTYWYDHAPGGWILAAALALFTDGFDRWNSAVDFGREFMLWAKLASAICMYAVCRRLRYTCSWSAVAVLLFGLCPLALTYTRWFYLDNLVTPWALAAMYLALSPRRSLQASLWSGLCLGLAIMMKETAVLLVPVVFWLHWRNCDPRNRMMSQLVFWSSWILVVVIYPLMATYKDELFDGPGHVSLEWTIRWQLTDRGSSGSILNDSGSRDLLMGWLGIDHWLLYAAVATIPIGLFVTRLRPITFGLIIGIAVMLRDAYLPVPHVILLLPFAAMLIAGVGNQLWGEPLRVGFHTPRPCTRRYLQECGVFFCTLWNELRLAMGRPVSIMALPLRATNPLRKSLVLAVCAAMLVPVVPDWQDGVRHQLTANDDAPMRQSVAWLSKNVDRKSMIVVDDSQWVDLVHRHGFRPAPSWVYKTDLDPAEQARVPHWSCIDYIAVYDSLFSIGEAQEKFPTVIAARDHSRAAARFGTGSTRITIYEVQPTAAEQHPCDGPRNPV